jgi:hypothetical protein
LANDRVKKFEVTPHTVDGTLVALGQGRDGDPHVESLTDHGFNRRRPGRIEVIDGRASQVISFSHGPPRCHTPGRIAQAAKQRRSVEKYASRRIELDDRYRRRRQELAVSSAANRPVLIPASKERADVLQRKPFDLEEV